MLSPSRIHSWNIINQTILPRPRNPSGRQRPKQEPDEPQEPIQAAVAPHVPARNLAKRMQNIALDYDLKKDIEFYNKETEKLEGSPYVEWPSIVPQMFWSKSKTAQLDADPDIWSRGSSQESNKALWWNNEGRSSSSLARLPGNQWLQGSRQWHGI